MRLLIPFLFVSAAFLPWISASELGPQATRETLPQKKGTKESHLFVEIPGVQEFSSRLIVRPLQIRDLLAKEIPLQRARRIHAAARHVLTRWNLLEYIPETDESILQVPTQSNESDMAQALLSTGLFQYAEPDWVVFPGDPQGISPTTATPAGPRIRVETIPIPNCPDDPMLSLQWHHSPQVLRSCSAWNLETGSPSVSIGMCDTGLRLSHEDLQNNRLKGYNAVDRLWESQGGQITPAHFHGTRTTGVAVATGNNGLGIAGVGWNLSYRMLRVSNASDGGAMLSVLQHAARTAAENGDRVVNVSYQASYFASNLPTASYVKSLGSILMFCAGNVSANYSFSDRDADDLLVVGSSDPNDNLAGFSNYGTYIDLVAPGTLIRTTDSGSDSDYVTTEGTSYSSPMVAGVCAMIWSQRPNLSPNDLEAILKASCVDIGAPGVDVQFGHGRVDLLGALQTNGSAPPTAEFSAPVQEGRSPLTVDFRDLSSGIPTAWLWDFGDGTTSNVQNPSHVYTNLGTYSVSLTATNALGNDTVTVLNSVLVDVIPPIADFSVQPAEGLAPLPVQFTDTSLGGLPTSWAWDFGDGTTSSLQNPTHTYTVSGFYTVSLVASNAYGADTRVQTDLVAVDLVAPVAEFSATPIAGNSPLLVSFTDESVGGTATQWNWNFGDGVGSLNQNPIHLYTASGTYSVSLTASNPYGSDQKIRSGYVTVGAGPPILALFSATPTSGTAPLTVTFADESLGAVTDWVWEFDDGTTSTEQNPVHTFTSAGAYNIVFQVSDALGNDNSIERQAFIVVQ